MNRNQSKTIALTLSLALAATSITACSMKKGLDQMQADTHGMADTTKVMAATTQGMAAVTNQMKAGMDKSNNSQSAVLSRIDFATYASRQGASSDYRGKFLANMKNEKAIAGKLKYASIFMQAFEFQVWLPSVSDAAYRDVLFSDAVDELVETIKALRKKSDKANATSTGDRMNDLYALAATLHKINPIQDQFYSNSEAPFPQYSMLNVITDGLRSMKDVHDNKVSLKDLPVYVQHVQAYHDDLEFMLQVRYNFIVAFSWSHLKDGGPDSQMDLLGKLISHGILPEVFTLKYLENGKGWKGFKKLILKGEEWEPKWDSLPAAQVDRAGEIMEYAVATRKILSLINLPIHDDRAIRNVMKTLTWSPDKLPVPAMRAIDCNNFEGRSRFKNALDNYLSVDPTALPIPTFIKGWTGGAEDVVANPCTKKPLDPKQTFKSNTDPFDGI